MRFRVGPEDLVSPELPRGRVAALVWPAGMGRGGPGLEKETDTCGGPAVNTLDRPGRKNSSLKGGDRGL